MTAAAADAAAAPWLVGSKEWSSLPACMSQTQSRPSAEPEAHHWPKGVKRSAVTGDPWPRKALHSTELRTSHSRTTQSAPPETRAVPSVGCQSRAETAALCPGKLSNTGVEQVEGFMGEACLNASTVGSHLATVASNVLRAPLSLPAASHRSVA